MMTVFDLNTLLLVFCSLFEIGQNFTIFASNSFFPEKEASFSVVFPTIEKRYRRSAFFEEETSTTYNKRLFINSPEKNINFTLDLIPATNILSPEFVVFETFQNRSTVFPIDYQEIQNCLYRSSTAALSVCDGQVTGVIHHNSKDIFFIRPIQNSNYDNNTKSPHLLIHKNLNDSYFANKTDENERECLHHQEESEKISYYLSNNEKDLKRRKYIQKREISREHDNGIFVETAVFVDNDLYNHMKNYFPNITETKLIRFVLAMVNAVQLLYHDPSLGESVNFVLKRLEILKEEPENLIRSTDIDRYLFSFCKWQSTKNVKDLNNKPKHWDHALMLTGLDLHVKSKHGKITNQVVGLAPVAGMCNPISSCTVNEGKHFESVYVVAHEIGHNLGMRHDGPTAENNCDPSSYIMSPTLGSGKITWSSCSREYLKAFLELSQSDCLFDRGNSSIQLDHEAEGSLPGERFNADQQCKLKYGRGSKHADQQPLEDICHDLHCDRGKYTWTSHPALEGTKCGHNKWCRGGNCVLRKLNSLVKAYVSSSGGSVVEKINGRWSKWETNDDCYSGCLFGNEGKLETQSTGVIMYVRKCDNPSPQGGGKPCQGINKKYKTCTAKQCLQVPRLTITEFANQICTRAKTSDSNFTGTGFQKNGFDAHESCTVWCQRKNGQVTAQGWNFPDGTTCSIKHSNKMDSNFYCLNGKCEEFVCKISDDIQFMLNSETCLKHKNQRFHKVNSKKVNKIARNDKIWTSSSSCHYNCILPGKGIRLVYNKHERKYNVQLCQPDKRKCNKLSSALNYASTICKQYKKKVKGLSGFGMQILPSGKNTEDQTDRSCKVACQDKKILHRFYVINGEEGSFPSGTSCSGLENSKNSYCVSGKCIEFGSDDIPVTELNHSLLLPLL